MNSVPYFRQKHSRACSLAVLRMVLAHSGINVSEKDLLVKVEKDYGKGFKDLWNPTIAKLAREYKVKTTMYALWPLFKKEKLKQALKEYRKSPEEFDVTQYENTIDKDTLSEPLPLAYKEMFKAIERRCKVVYGKLTKTRIKSLLKKNNLIQTSVKLQRLYRGHKGFHSILLYGFKGDDVFYHDPHYGKSMTANINKLIKAAGNVGAAIIYDVY